MNEVQYGFIGSIQNLIVGICEPRPKAKQNDITDSEMGDAPEIEAFDEGFSKIFCKKNAADSCRRRMGAPGTVGNQGRAHDYDGNRDCREQTRPATKKYRQS